MRMCQKNGRCLHADEKEKETYARLKSSDEAERSTPSIS